MSHQIGQLEERLDRRLFERGPRGVMLMVEGCGLLEAVGGHFEGIEHALSRCRERLLAEAADYRQMPHLCGNAAPC